MRSPGRPAAPAVSAALAACGVAACGVAACGVTACGPSPAHVHLEPVPSGCARPDTHDLIVTALGDGPEVVHSVTTGGGFDFDDFPADTRQFQIKVLGDGGVTRQIGRSAPLVLADLADGSVVHLFMAPPDDGCVVGELTTPRDHPLVVAAGDGALVFGGTGPGGAVTSAEWYDPSQGAFEAIDTPDELHTASGALGMSATALPDGRVALIGGGAHRYFVFDPATRTFPVNQVLGEVRSHHASVALDAHHVLVAGGCDLIDVTGACTSPPRRSSFVLDVDDGTSVEGPDLQLARLDGVAVREPTTGDVILSGGDDGAGGPVDAERIDPSLGPGEGVSTVFAGANGPSAPLIAGSAVIGWAAEGQAADGATAFAVPGVDTLRAAGNAGPRVGPSLTPLEDGDVLVVGGDVALPVARFHPATGETLPLPARPIGPGDGHGAARMPDGTVLVVGGHDGADAALAGAWVFRPLGDAPFTGAVSVTPGGGDVPLVPLDPAAITTGTDYTIHGVAGGGLGGRVVVAGMMPREHDLTASLHVQGGLDVLFGIVDPDHLDVIELVPGQRAQLSRRDAGAVDERCHGEDVTPQDLQGLVALAVHVRDGTARVELGGRVVLDCPFVDPRAGSIGLAAPGAGDAVTLSTLAVTR